MRLQLYTNHLNILLNVFSMFSLVSQYFLNVFSCYFSMFSLVFQCFLFFLDVFLVFSQCFLLFSQCFLSFSRWSSRYLSSSVMWWSWVTPGSLTVSQPSTASQAMTRPCRWVGQNFSLPMFVYLLYVNSSPPGQNGRHFSDNSFERIFMNEKFCILIKISLKFVPNDPMDNEPVLV